MKIVDVTVTPKQVHVNDHIKVTFKVEGAQPKYFTFPFSNESLTEKLIEFAEEVK